MRHACTFLLLLGCQPKPQPPITTLPPQTTTMAAPSAQHEESVRERQQTAGRQEKVASGALPDPSGPRLTRTGVPIRQLLSSGDPEEGRPVFLENCARCHGEKGDGAGPMAKDLAAKPRDFRKGHVERLPPEHLYQVVKDGGAAVGLSRAMPAWRDKLSDDQIADVLAYVRGFSRGN